MGNNDSYHLWIPVCRVSIYLSIYIFFFSNPFNNPIRKKLSTNPLIQQILLEYLPCTMLCSFLGFEIQHWSTQTEISAWSLCCNRNKKENWDSERSYSHLPVERDWSWTRTHSNLIPVTKWEREIKASWKKGIETIHNMVYSDTRD